MTKRSTETIPLGSMGKIVRRNCGLCDFSVCYSRCHAWYDCAIAYHKPHEVPVVYSFKHTVNLSANHKFQKDHITENEGGGTSGR